MVLLCSVIIDYTIKSLIPRSFPLFRLVKSLSIYEADFPQICPNRYSLPEELWIPVFFQEQPPESMDPKT